jgi:hypothetical protein
MILLSFRYQTSTDYELLYELAQRESIICIVDYLFDEETVCRDVAKTNCFDGITVASSRGVTYLDAGSEKEFVSQCRRWNVEWIVPRGPHDPCHADALIELANK